MRRITTLTQMALTLNASENELTSTWEMPNKNFDKEVLLETIIHDYGNFPVLERNPVLFKYEAEMWWKKHYRTFTKWFDAFDISYSPLENYNRREERLNKSTEEGNAYSRFSNKNSAVDTRNSNIDNSGTSSRTEDTNIDNAKYNTGTSVGNVSGTGNKTNGSTETYSKDKTTDTAIDTDTRTRQSDSKTNTSGRMIAQYDAQGHIIGYTIAEGTERSIEHGASAYDEGAANVDTYSESNYSPSDLDITHGSMSDVGSLNNDVNVKTNNAQGANRVTEHETGSKNITAATENTTNSEHTTGQTEGTELGTQNQNITGTEIAHNSTNNIENANSNSSASGDSQTKNDVAREGQESAYIHGNIGVTTSQQMLEAEIKIQGFDIYSAMAELFADEMCVCIYLNDRQLGGHCLW